MRRHAQKVAVITAAVGGMSLLFWQANTVKADVIQDTMTNATETGGLAGSAPDIAAGNSRVWTSYWLTNSGPASGDTNVYNTLTSTSAAYPTGSAGDEYNSPTNIPATPVRGASGTTFADYGYNHVNNGAYISVNPGGTVITATANLIFNQTVGNWAYIGLDSNLTNNAAPPDVYNNAGGFDMIIRPAFNTDYAEFFYNSTAGSTTGQSQFSAGGLGTESTPSLTSIPASDGGVWNDTVLHTVQLSLNTSTGAVSGYVDGALVGSGTLNSTNLAAFDNPTNLGLYLGVRGNGSSTTTVPASVTFSNVSVPEPMSIGLLALGSIGLATRRRRA